MKRYPLLLGLLLTIVLLCGCQADEPKAADLLAPLGPPNVGAVQSPAAPKIDRQAVAEFAVQLFQQSSASNPDPNANNLISPLSVLMALGMTANGAADNTLAQMEEIFGMPVRELNKYLWSYTSRLPQTEKAALRLANSLWLNDKPDLLPKPAFLQTCLDYYNPSIYKAPFDEDTLALINAWVKENTDGKIAAILDEISPDAAIYLLNVLDFEAEWETVYNKHLIHQDTFTTADGQEQQADFMYSTENAYLQDENAQGFIKYFAGRAYAFVALLPNEDVELADYIASLSGAKLTALLDNPQNIEVYASIPKFTAEYTPEMNSLLQSLGLTDAFDPALADFSRLAEFPPEYNLYINQVLHKTYIKVDENGVSAGAATAVVMEPGAMPDPEYREVYLNRPFIYLLIDCRQKLPLFIGSLASIE